MVSNIEIQKRKLKSESPHSGHRQRVIQKYIDYGLDSFSEHEVWEKILLFSNFFK